MTTLIHQFRNTKLNWPVFNVAKTFNRVRVTIKMKSVQQNPPCVNK